MFPEQHENEEETEQDAAIDEVDVAMVDYRHRFSKILMLIDEKYKHKKVWYDDLAERAKGKLTLSLQTMLGQVDRKREELMSACKNDGTEE